METLRIAGSGSVQAGENSTVTPEMAQAPLADRRSALAVFALVSALGLIVLDLSTWAPLDVASIYGLPLMLAGATRDRRVLWIFTVLLIVATLVVYALQFGPGSHTLREPVFYNRLLDVVSLLAMTGLLHIWITSIRTSEARARLIKAQDERLEAARLSHRLVEVQETERRALANQLHDLVGQKLTALGINLEIMKAPSGPPDATKDNARLEDSAKLVQETIESIRNVMAELSPAVLGDFGLAPALRWYAEQFNKRTGVAISVQEQGQARRLAARAEEELFRIAQEALANVTKHARAREIVVTLEFMPRDIRLSIADDGCGFDATAPQEPSRDDGWGLMIMRERAATVGGQFEVESAPGRGTRVSVILRSDAP
ncbi:MAG: sensor histidine kinase [Betaproteobacteria bacterium]|nr:sensor histidine kinase [Betaproteobacteria bacterium]